MIEEKINLISSKEDVERYLKVNGISGKAKDTLIAKWEAARNAPIQVSQEPEILIEEPTMYVEEPEVLVNEVKTAVIDAESVEVKEE